MLVREDEYCVHIEDELRVKGMKILGHDDHGYPVVHCLCCECNRVLTAAFTQEQLESATFDEVKQAYKPTYGDEVICRECFERENLPDYMQAW